MLTAERSSDGEDVESCSFADCVKDGCLAGELEPLLLASIPMAPFRGAAAGCAGGSLAFGLLIAKLSIEATLRRRGSGSSEGLDTGT